MKKSLFGIIAIASMVMTGCTQEVEQLVMDDMKNVEFTGTIEDVDTRTSMDNTGKVIWCENDPVSIFMRNGNHYKYQAKSGGTTNTTLAYANWYAKGSASLDKNYAVYPFDEDNAFDATTKKFTVDLSGLAEQTYTENNFQEGISVMTAKAPDTDLPFYNALSMLKVRLSSSVPEAYRITEIKIASDSKVLSGKDATIDLSGEDGKVAAVLTSGDNTITLDCVDDENGDGVVISTEPTDFYILVPVNEIPAGDFTITITGTDVFTDKEYATDETINKDFTFERSKIVTYERTITAEDWKGSIEDVIGNNDIVLKDDYAEVSSANGLLKWAYIANNKDNTYGLKLMNDIEMPEYEIEVDADNETYIFTEKAITVTDGVPSGSNWIPITMHENVVDSKYFKGEIEGNNHSVSGLLITADNVAVGFVGWMHQDAILKNMTIDNSVIYNAGGNKGETYTGAAVGRSHNGTLVENVHITKSKITGTNEVGGVVGRNYRRVRDDNGGQRIPYDDKLSYIVDCTTDYQTIVSGKSEVGGICGRNDGAIILHCINNADVKGTSSIGGVVGHTCSYNIGGINGYVIASGSTKEAEITGSENAGGIAGITYLNPGHEEGGSKSYIVACYSESTITSVKAGTMIGRLHSKKYWGQIVSSWAKQVYNMSYDGDGAIMQSNMYSSDHFVSPENITQEMVAGMNNAIAEYNQTPGVEQACHYTWSWTSGSWPELVKQ